MSTRTSPQQDPAVAATLIADNFKARVKTVRTEAALYAAAAPAHAEIARLKDEQITRQAAALATAEVAGRYIEALEFAASTVRLTQLEAYANIPTEES